MARYAPPTVLVINGLHTSDATSGGRAYLVEGPMECVLVDTGAPDGTLGVGHLARAARRQLHEIRLIVLTHAHRGHAGNADEVRRLTGARLAASERTAELLRTPGAAVSGGGSMPWRRGRDWPPEPIRVDDILTPGQVLDLAGGIAVVDAPGHLPGAIALHCYGPNALLTGDAAAIGRSGALRPPPARHCASPAIAAETAARLAAIGARVIGPGHGWPTVDGRRPRRLWGPS